MSLLYELARALAVAGVILAGVCWFATQYPTADNPCDVPQTCVVDLNWSADGRTLLSRTRGGENCDGRLWLHAAGNGPAALSLPMGGVHLAHAVLLPDGSAALVVGDSGGLWRIDLQSQAEAQLLEIPARYDVSALAVSSDGANFAVALKFDVLLCDSRSGRELLQLPHQAPFVSDVIFSDDGRLVAIAAADGVIRLWNRLSGECESVLSGPISPVVKVAFVKGQQRLASVTAASDAALYLWDTATGERLWRKSVDSCGPLALAVTPDGALAATGGFNREVALWDLQNRVQIASLSGHTATIRALQFAPNGATLASGADDGMIRIWNVYSRELVETVDLGKLNFNRLRQEHRHPASGP
ncbi:MAG: WD40 repeat domain-containing protein [Planctomycetaceae bacterium]